MNEDIPTIEEIKGAAVRLHSRWYFTLLGGIGALVFWFVLYALTSGRTSSHGGMFKGIILLMGIGFILRGIIGIFTAKALWISKEWVLLSAWGKVIAWKRMADVSQDSWGFKEADGFDVFGMIFGSQGLGLMMQTRKKEQQIWLDRFGRKKLVATLEENAAKDVVPQGVLFYIEDGKRIPTFFRYDQTLSLCSSEGKIVRGERDAGAWFRIEVKKPKIRRKDAGLCISKTKPKELAVDEEGELCGFEFKVSTTDFVYRGL